MKMLPLARSSDLIERELDKELLIYDLQIDKAYSLNETSRTVFKACDGKTSFEELERLHKYSYDLIYFTLRELKTSNLIDGEVADPFGSLSRREIVRRVGLASMTALPVILSIAAPTAAMAQSASTQRNIAACQPCTSDSECASGNCAFLEVDKSNNVCSNTEFKRAYRPSDIIPWEYNPNSYESVMCALNGALYCCAGNGSEYSAFLKICTCKA